MPKYKLSKSDEQWLRNEAKKLPPDYSQTMNKEVITGAELALTGIKKTTKGETVVRDAVYLHNVPNRTNMNHFRRMKKAFEERGWEGVNIYLDKYRVEEDKIFKTAPKQPEPEKPKSLMQKIRSKFLA